MNKTFLILFLALSFGSSADTKCLSKIELTREATQKQLNKYNCNNIINNVTKEQKNTWHCSKTAPKGWASFYSNKLEKLKNKSLSCSS
jgi:hypothetical protein